MLLIGVVALLLCCGGGGSGAWYLAQSFSDSDQGDGGDRTATGKQSDGAGADQAGGQSAGAAGSGNGAAQSVRVNRAVWYAGYKISFGTVGYTPSAESDQLVAEVTLGNLGKESVSYPILPIVFSAGGTHLPGRLKGTEIAPGDATTAARFVFQVSTPIAKLAEGRFVLGEATEVQAEVPIDAKAAFDPLEPRKVAAAVTFRAGGLEFAVSGCELRAAYQDQHEQHERGTRGLWCGFDLRGVEVSKTGHFVQIENYRMRLPNGTVNAPGKLSKTALLYPDAVEHGVSVEWVVAPWPTTGRFLLNFSDLGPYPGQSTTVIGTHEIAVTFS
mgnify:FL=1